jgi:putative ABC transport system permease protein
LTERPKTFTIATYGLSHMRHNVMRTITVLVTLMITMGFLILTLSLFFGLASEFDTDSERRSILEGKVPTSTDLFRDLRIDRDMSEGSRQALVELLLFTTVLVCTVSFFIIYNTMALSVRERRREIGILRALGLSSWEVTKLFLAEGGFIGLVSWISALFLGMPLILNLSVYLLERGDTAFFFVAPAIPPQLLVVSFLSCMGLCLVSTYLAARTRIGSSPVKLMRSQE